jgi:hypothetical protein
MAVSQARGEIRTAASRVRACDGAPFPRRHFHPYSTLSIRAARAAARAARAALAASAASVAGTASLLSSLPSELDALELESESESESELESSSSLYDSPGMWQ